MFARSPHVLGPIFHTILKTRFRDFPGGPVVLRLCSLSMQGWAGLIPGQGTNSPNALWHGQKLKKKKKKDKKTEVLTQKDAIKHRRDFSVSFQCLKTRWCHQQCVSRGHVYNPVPREGGIRWKHCFSVWRLGPERTARGLEEAGEGAEQLLSALLASLSVISAWLLSYWVSAAARLWQPISLSAPWAQNV